MRSTKQYGLVNSWQEHQMLVHAEHTYERKHKQNKKLTGQRLPAFKVHKNIKH